MEPEIINAELMRQRRKYDSFIVWLYNQNKEHLLPAAFVKSIPASTRHDWRNMDYCSAYTGSRFAGIQQEGLRYCELFLKYRNLKRTFDVVSRVWVMVSDIMLPAISKSKQHAELFINEIQRLITVMPKSMALKIAGMSAQAFRYRLERIKNRCMSSALSLCFRRYPLQLSAGEMSTIKALLTDEQYACWPISSIHWQAKRTGRLLTGLTTLYNYAHRLGLCRRFRASEKKTEGLNATRPNQYLHVDTKYWPLNDVNYAIVFVSDNFSKAVLGWSMAAGNAADNVIVALREAIRTIGKYYPDQASATLVADGGGENHAVCVQELIAKTPAPAITKIIARKDITFSNSPIEAINKIMKRYIRHQQPQTAPELYRCIEIAVKDYSFQRPHHSLKGLTPMEAYTKKEVNLDFSAQAARAKAKRIEENRRYNCEACR